MSNERKQWLGITPGQIIQTLMGAIVAVLLWGGQKQLQLIRMDMQNAILQSSKDAQDTYVSRGWFAKYAETTQKTVDKIADTQEKMTANIAKMTTDIAVVKTEIQKK